MSASTNSPTESPTEPSHQAPDLDRYDFAFGFALPRERWVREMRRRLAEGESREALFGPRRPSPYYMLEVGGIRLIGYWANDWHHFLAYVVEMLDSAGRRAQRLNRHPLHFQFEDFADADHWCAELIEHFRPRSEGKELEGDWVDVLSSVQGIPVFGDRVRARKEAARKVAAQAATEATAQAAVAESGHERVVTSQGISERARRKRLAPAR